MEKAPHDSVEDKQGEQIDVAQQGKERLWTGMFVLIVLLTFLCFLSGQGVNSSLSVFIGLKGGSSTFAGVLAAVFSLSAAATRVAVGPLIDRFGRKLFMSVGFAVLLMGFVGPLLCADAPAFVLWRFLQGAGFASVTSATATAAADVLALSRIGEGVGYLGLGQAVAMSIGPAIALWLVGTDPAENVFIGLIAVAAFGLVLSFLCVYERHPERLPHTSAFYQRYKRAAGAKEDVEDRADSVDVVDSDVTRDPSAHGWRRFIEPASMPGVVPILVLSPLFGFSIYFCGLYGVTIGVGNTGLYFTFSAITMIIVRISGKSFMDRVGPIWLHAIAAVCGMIAMALLLGAGWNHVLFYIAGLFYGVCMGLGIPVNQAVVVKCAPASRWGVANSVFLLSQDVGIGIAVVLWGAVNDGFGFSVSLVSAIAVAALSLVVAWIMYPGHGIHPLVARGVE